MYFIFSSNNNIAFQKIRSVNKHQSMVYINRAQHALYSTDFHHNNINSNNNNNTINTINKILLLFL